MKKILYGCWLVWIACCVSCQHEDIDGYDKSKDYIYIDIPYVLDQFGRETTTRQDSISYSFALDDLSVEDTVIKVVVKKIGVPATKDCPYTIELIEEETTATSDLWDVNVLKNRSIKSGQIADTVAIRVKRALILSEQWMQIKFRLLPNEYFETGYANLQEVKVSFSDILMPPSWWRNTGMFPWGAVFGPFYREVYYKWMEIYYLGADPTIGDNDIPYYWDNMPAYANESWYPTTYSYIRILRDYFEKNEVYPDGDPSKPRIKIPFAN
ncbi:MAG: DUF4843 domain-containing protein [Odoribacter sp.]|nr:DUF4843 domain-containing protein [Odoribacter sp.]